MPKIITVEDKQKTYEDMAFAIKSFLEDKKMNIYLIGMPGSGKTTIGKLLADKLSKTFVDLDHKIERDALMFVDEIFEQYGEKMFRDLETKALEEVSTCDDLVVSTGGGIVTQK